MTRWHGPDFDGDTYEHELDYHRLGRQFVAVFDLMRDGNWRTLRRISRITGYPEASVSARLRDFRKVKFGSHDLESRRCGRRDSGLWKYRLILNPDCIIRGGRGMVLLLLAVLLSILSPAPTHAYDLIYQPGSSQVCALYNQGETRYLLGRKRVHFIMCVGGEREPIVVTGGLLTRGGRLRCLLEEGVYHSTGSAQGCLKFKLCDMEIESLPCSALDNTPEGEDR